VGDGLGHLAGDAVETDEVIVQIETDKVTIDVRAPAAGVVQGIQVRESNPSSIHDFVPSTPARGSVDSLRSCTTRRGVESERRAIKKQRGLHTHTTPFAASVAH
jgi:hypothetical protein